MVPGTWTLVLDPARGVYFRGLDYEGRKLQLWARTQQHIVLKVHGGKVWNGNYVRRRHEAGAFEVYRLIKTHTEGRGGRQVTVCRVEALVEFPLTRRGLYKP